MLAATLLPLLVLGLGSRRPAADPAPPHIANLSATAGCVDDLVTVYGANFGARQGTSMLTFNGRPAGIVSWTDSLIRATVPYFTSSGPVRVTTPEGSSNAVTFTVLPRVTGISPNPAAPGDVVMVTGTSFGLSQGSGTISFAGKAPASVRAWSDMKIEAVLPSDVESGDVFVTTASGTSNPASLGISTVWYFAEGTTRSGFEEWLCLLNPGERAAQVTVYYMTASSGVIERGYTVGARSRFTLSVNHEVGPEQDVSIKVVSDEFLVAERPMYFNYRGVWPGGDNVIGARAPSTEWYFAEGCTRSGYEEWLCLQNPGSTATLVRATYLIGGEAPQVRTYELAPRSRSTVFVNLEVGPEKDASVNLKADAPIVAERPMYFLAGGYWAGGHDVVGATSPSAEWYFAEGCTRVGFSQWLCLANPNDAAAQVDVSFVLGSGEVKPYPRLSIPPKSRSTISVFAAVGAGQDVATMVRSDSPIVAERPMYFNYSGKWAGGHDVMGARSPAERFYFAEGYTGAGFEEWMCIFNPSPDRTAQVKVTFMFKGGGTQELQREVGPYSRVTFSVNYAAGFDKEVSAVVESTNGVGVVAERPIYFNYSGKWAGGHDVIGYTP
jgi:hypothetical protein